MKAFIPGVALRAVSSALPAQTLALSSLGAQFGHNEVKRIMRSTGIDAVRSAGELSAGQLCLAAARSLLKQTGLDARSIDALVLVTQTPDCLMPGTSTWLQHQLGMRQDVVAWDVNLGCSGYVYGLYQAAMLLACGGCERVLVCTGDVVTKLLHPDDHHVRMVFGDGATATLVERGSDALGFAFHTNGGGLPHLFTPLRYTGLPASTGGAHASASVGPLHMDGAEVMSFVLASVPEVIGRLLADRQLKQEQVSVFLMHQANRLILHYLAKTLGVRPDAVPIQLAKVGNTGPSSIPLMLSMGVEGMDLHRRDAVMCGFGVGLSVGSVLCDLSRTQFIPPVDVPAGTRAFTKEQSDETEGHLV
jgi:3-oxoacyl-[acyl-carrier-protein] synthase-3